MIQRKDLDQDCEVILRDDCIHWPECHRILIERWDASSEEVALWVHNDRLRAFTCLLAVRTDDDVELWRWCRGEMRFEGCSGVIDADALLSRFGYSIMQVERFNPEVNPQQESSPGEYRPGAFGMFENPSGRYLSYYQAVVFLASCPCGDQLKARAAVNEESKEKRLSAQHFTGLFLAPDRDGSGYALQSGSPRFADALFPESQVLGIAKQWFGADIRAWDAASRPRWDGREPDAHQFVGPHSSLTQQADAGKLPAWLSADQIAFLHPEGNAFADRLLNAHISGALKAATNVAEIIRNPENLSRTDGEILLSGAMLLVHRADLHAYLERYETWPLPVGAKLSGWWPELQSTVKSDSAEAQEHVESNALDSTKICTPDQGLTIFQAMQGLQFTEVTLRFSTGNLIEVSARGVARRVSCGEFGVLNMTTGRLNQNGGLLLGMSHGQVPPKGETKIIKAMSRLRAVLREKLNLRGDPFATDWTPHLTIEDGRDACDEKARRDARHVPFDEHLHSVQEYPFEPPDDDDEAALYLT